MDKPFRIQPGLTRDNVRLWTGSADNELFFCIVMIALIEIDSGSNRQKRLEQQ